MTNDSDYGGVPRENYYDEDVYHERKPMDHTERLVLGGLLAAGVALVGTFGWLMFHAVAADPVLYGKLVGAVALFLVVSYAMGFGVDYVAGRRGGD